MSAGALGGCHKKAAVQAAGAPSAEQVKQSLDALKKQLHELEVSFGQLRKQYDAIPPGLEGFSQVRATFFQTEEGRGIIDARATLIASRLDAALASGKTDELPELSKEIADTAQQVKNVDQLYLGLLHRAMAFQRMADHAKEEEAADAAKAAAAKEKAEEAKPAKVRGKSRRGRPAAP